MPTIFPRPPPSFWRLSSLNIERAHLFNETYNPKRLRLGNKILKKRLRARAMENYYPPSYDWTPRKLARIFPGLTFEDPERDYRLMYIEEKKWRGKGPPAKTTKADFMKEQMRAEERKLKAEAARMKAALTDKSDQK